MVGLEDSTHPTLKLGRAEAQSAKRQTASRFLHRVADQLVVLGNLMAFGGGEVGLADDDQVEARSHKDVVVPLAERGERILWDVGPFVRCVVPPQIAVRLVEFLRRSDRFGEPLGGDELLVVRLSVMQYQPADSAERAGRRVAAGVRQSDAFAMLPRPVVRTDAEA